MAREKPRAGECVGWVALTFDDGPVVTAREGARAGGTLGVVEVLDVLGVPGTYFMLGREMKEHPSAVRRVLAGGGVVGNSTWDHPDVRTLTERQVNHQLKRTKLVYREISGRDMKWWRPPYGARGRGGRRAGRDDRDPLDRRPAELAARAGVGDVVRASRGMEDGGILTLAEGKATTVRALPRIVGQYWAQGCASGCWGGRR